MLRHDLQAHRDGFEKSAMRAIEAAGERHERPKKMLHNLSNSSEANSNQRSNLIRQSNYCAQSNSDQGLSCTVEEFIRDARTSKVRALQIYDSSRRTVEFAIQA